MARKDKLAVRIVKQQGEDNVSQCALARTREDVEKKRHKRNPFDDSYVQLLQTPLEGIKVQHTLSIDQPSLRAVSTMRHCTRSRLACHLGSCLVQGASAAEADDSNAQVEIESTTTDLHVRVEVRRNNLCIGKCCDV